MPEESLPMPPSFSRASAQHSRHFADFAELGWPPRATIAATIYILITPQASSELVYFPGVRRCRLGERRYRAPRGFARRATPSQEHTATYFTPRRAPAISLAAQDAHDAPALFTSARHSLACCSARGAFTMTGPKFSQEAHFGKISRGASDNAA